MRRTPLLRWHAYVNWPRLCDSLLFTGLSVPILELGLRTLILDRGLGLNSLNAPLWVFSAMSLANGVYIAAHNYFRSLPRAAVVGNLFRSLLAIPVSLAYNNLALTVCALAGWPTALLPSLASILAKLASDTVAGVIEGLADKAEFSSRRHWDYQNKLAGLFDNFSALEMELPEQDALETLRRLADPRAEGAPQISELEKNLIVNALDLMYFWYYQPRARSVLARHIEEMSPEEKDIFSGCQRLLSRVRLISQMLMDGLAGPDFSRSLAFYLSKYKDYLAEMSELTGLAAPTGPNQTSRQPGTLPTPAPQNHSH